MNRGDMRNKSKELWIPRILVIGACALLVYSFVVLDSPLSSSKTTQTLIKSDRNESNNRLKENDKDPLLVFIVIDAWRLSFLTSPSSPMNFSASSISNGHARLFDAFARMPTVTLPRITAYITGTLPSFGTILTNLATDEINIPNWISLLESSGKRIHFFGDDTWIRLLPGAFEKSEGVTSFFVNDYTEVDQNVTRHLDLEFENFPDVLILHYLGLDHIGHSLGGNSPKIPEKLREMDEIIRKIVSFLENQSQESYLIVCGDHGMTPSGSHGGASPEETRVPVLIWNFSVRSENSKPLDNLTRRIEQIDISSTIFDLFNLELPLESYGISLAGDFRDETKMLEKQHKHFKRIVREKRLQISDICENQCEYTSPFIQSALKIWFKQVQEELIGTSSDVPNLSICICIFILITSTAISIRTWISGERFWLNSSIFLINLINFASSLIEEEHEIWYYLGSTVVFFKAVRIIRGRKYNKLKFLVLLGILHRISLGYMQSTRRRWSMDSSLLPISPFSEYLDLKNVKDSNTISGSHPIFIVLMSSLCWLTALEEYRFLLILPMVSQYLNLFEIGSYHSYMLNIIRLSFLPIGYFSGYLLNGLLLLILAITPISQLMLLFFVFQIGRLSEKLKFRESENLIFCMAAFFYTGNSNSLSTLSLSTGYVGLSDYSPPIVGLQLLLYTFAGPIVFLCGRSRTSQSWLHLHFSYRISALSTSLICLLIFQNHLFVWSVYSPKVIYDMAHLIFFGFIGLL